jgi:hypothetical protein
VVPRCQGCRGGRCPAPARSPLPAVPLR